MKVAVLCESSGTVRDAFIRNGHEAISCDISPTERPGPHIIGNVMDYDWNKYDLVISHPPCTHLAVSGARWFANKKNEQEKALRLVTWLLDLDVEHSALENPVSIISSRIRKPDQIIQPWQFGHGERKATCLWLRNLPPLRPTNVVSQRAERVHRMRPTRISWVRSRERSRTYAGIAEAMAEQWGKQTWKYRKFIEE